MLLCILFHAGVNFALGVVGVDLLTTSRRVLTILLALTAALAWVLYRRIRSVGALPSRLDEAR